MVQKVEERGGHILLYFGSLPEHLDAVEFVVVVAYRRGRILYARWREGGCWTLPSGRVEHGETPEEAARRELLEETGATLKQIRVLCYMHCFMFGREYWGVTYLGEVSELGTPQKPQCLEMFPPISRASSRVKPEHCIMQLSGTWQATGASCMRQQETMTCLVPEKDRFACDNIAAEVTPPGR